MVEGQENQMEQILGQSMGETPAQIQCPFCLISEGKIPAMRVFETENFIAALEIKPANPGHTIIFPKNHTKDLVSLPKEQLTELIELISRISHALEEISEGVNIIINLEKSAGQFFDHLTVNLIPRFDGDNLTFGWQPKQLSEDEMGQLQTTISEKLKPEEKEVSEEIPEEDLSKETIKPEDRSP